MEKKVKILVACHKPVKLPENEMLLPIQVGAAASDMKLGIQRDDEGENISDKNYCYCELTALYWAWKNLKDVDVIGLCHYRRYFDFHNQGRLFYPSTAFPSKAMDNLDFSVEQETIERVLRGEVVASRAMHLNSTLKLHYCEYHVSDDYRTLKEVVDETQEAKYKKAFNSVFVYGYKLHPFNMMMMRKLDFDAYCTWLFGVLSIVERRTDIRNYSPHQKRIYGFMAERLFNVWLEAENKTIVEKPMIFIERNMSEMPDVSFSIRKSLCYLRERRRCAKINKLFRKTPQ